MWIVLIIGAAILSQIFPIFLLMANGMIYLGLVSAALIAALIAMISTSRADRAGTRRFLISEIGIAVVVPEGKYSQSSGDGFRNWQHGDFLRFRHVSRFWTTMDVLDLHHVRVLRIGFRVSADDGPEIEAMIRELLASADLVDPADASNLYRSDQS